MAYSESPPSLDSLGGVWQRSLLITEDGTKDLTSLVWWLQLGSYCGDIRAAAGAHAADTAFAGTLLRRGDIFTWSPEIAVGAVTDGATDEGRLTFEGDLLREDGVHSRYLEHWQRIAPAQAGDCAICFDVDSAGQPGFLLMIGTYVFIARPRPDADPTFLMARHGDGVASVVMALGGTSKPGDPVELPKLNNDILYFPAGPTGPICCYRAQALDTCCEKTETCA